MDVETKLARLTAHQLRKCALYFQAVATAAATADERTALDRLANAERQARYAAWMATSRSSTSRSSPTMMWVLVVEAVEAKFGHQPFRSRASAWASSSAACSRSRWHMGSPANSLAISDNRRARARSWSVGVSTEGIIASPSMTSGSTRVSLPLAPRNSCASDTERCHKIC
jgi:hypothetical protein